MLARWIDRRWRPDANVFDILRVDFQGLYDAGYRLVLLDIDNTLVPHGAREPDARAQEAVARIRKARLAIIVVSNARSRRSSHFCSLLDIKCLPYAGKPSPRGVFSACQMMGVEPARSVLIGDQLFTDVAAAKSAGAASIRVSRISESEPLHIRFKRVLENILFRKFALQTEYVNLRDPDQYLQKGI